MGVAGFYTHHFSAYTLYHNYNVEDACKREEKLHYMDSLCQLSITGVMYRAIYKMLGNGYYNLCLLWTFVKVTACSMHVVVCSSAPAID